MDGAGGGRRRVRSRDDAPNVGGARISAQQRAERIDEDASPRVVAALDILEGAQALERTMSPLRDLFGVKHLSYVAARYGRAPHKDPYVLSTYPPMWLVRYLFKRYWRIDPVVKAGFARATPFDWCEIERDPAADAFFEDAAQYGVGRNGFLIPLQNQNGQRGILSFSSDASDAQWSQLVAGVLGDMTEIAHVVHRAALREVFGDEALPPRLSPREAETLQWVAEGKEVPDIALITGLSEHTVRTYLKSARLKLDCGTKAQAAVKAERLALFARDEP